MDANPITLHDRVALTNLPPKKGRYQSGVVIYITPGGDYAKVRIAIGNTMRYRVVDYKITDLKHYGDGEV